jgi:DNA polymerase-3 subunit gamma/tau
MIRNVEAWARLSPMGPRKTVVIENADRMLESSRNAMLKILEEPPESVRFVLASSRRSAVMATILSRSRTYRFAPRDEASAALVVERVFRSSESAPSVESFLAARRPFPPAEARGRARAFLAAALASLASRRRGAGLDPPLEALAREGEASSGRAAALAELLEATKDFGQREDRLSGSFGYFLEALCAIIGELLREPGMGPAGIEYAARAAGLARAASSDWRALNRSPSLLAESLMYALGSSEEASA